MVVLSRRLLVAGAAGLVAGCAPAIVRRVESIPIAPDPAHAILVVVDVGRSRYSTVFVGTDRVLGACVLLTHFVVTLPAGRHFLVAYDDESYDAAELDLASGGIYAVEVEHSSGELEIHPLLPQRDPIRRLLDETDRVELVRQPNREARDTFARKVRLARVRYAEYGERKRAARAVGPAHTWR